MSGAHIFELVLLLLGFIIALHMLASKLRWPPFAALMIGGGALAFVPGLPAFSLDPELALVLFLPPLLMDGAFSTPLGRFRRYLPGILSLAIGAVVFTTLAVGVITHWLVPSLPLAVCFALGAVVSPPDAVSARAVLSGINLPRRLSALLEGESLINDATGLILFRFSVAAALSGTFTLSSTFMQFGFVAIGGGVIGYLVGRAWLLILARMEDLTLIVLTSCLLGWTAYIIGENLHVSGVIATVAAGMVLGWHQHTVFSAAVRRVGVSFWRVMVFGLEAMVFILIGFSLRSAIERMGGIDGLPSSWALTVAAVVLTITVARFIWIFGQDIILGIAQRIGIKLARPLGWRQATVLSWAGMRGVVTLAVPLALPAEMPGRDLMLVCAFSVIFVTVIVQGSSLGWLIRLVAPADNEPAPKMTMPMAEGAIARARMARVEQIAYDENGTLIHPMLLEDHRRRLTYMERYEADSELAMEQLRPHFDLILNSLSSGRQELIRLHRAGLIEDEVLHDLERDLDIEEMAMVFQRGE